MRPNLSHVRSIVVKLGTQVLSDSSKRLELSFLQNIADQVNQLRARNISVTLVSSGAIGAGMSALNLTRRPTDLAQLQAVAAVGQRRLMDAWADAFAPHGLQVAQVLLTREDIDSRQRFLNLRNTIHAVHALGAVPIINENDTISTDELVRISFGDNDILAALVATSLRADMLVLLSVVDGVLDGQGKSIRTVEKIADAQSHVRTDQSAMGKGGMNSKVEAARIVTRNGSMLIVAHGRNENILPRLLNGDELGTIFLPNQTHKTTGRNRWIDAARPVGTIVIDDGAARAILERKKSLLPAGIIKIEGLFKPGDMIAITKPDGTLIARGLSNYSSTDVLILKGKKTAEVKTLMPGRAYDEVVHRDNLVVIT